MDQAGVSRSSLTEIPASAKDHASFSAVSADSNCTSSPPGRPSSRKLAKPVLPDSSSKDRNIRFCRVFIGTKIVRGSRWFPCNPNRPNASAPSTPPSSLFRETNLLSRSPESGASLEKRPGSSTRRIRRSPCFAAR